MKTLLTLILSMFMVVAQANEIKVIIGYSPGGGTDYVVRTVVGDSQKDSDINYVVENRPGASGSIAIRQYLENTDKKILGVSGGQVFYETFINPENNFLDTLIMVGPVLYSPMALGIASNAKIKTISDLFNKSIPKQRINIATAGGANELLVEVLKKHSHHDIVSVRFKSSGDAYTALLGNHVDFQSAEYGFFKTKQVPVMLVAGRSVDNVPSLRTHIKDSDIVNFFGFSVSKDSRLPTVENSIRSSFVKNNRKEFFDKIGYYTDMNVNNDYLAREMLPKYKTFSAMIVK